MPLISLVYVSFASHDLSDDELKAILAKAREKNKRLNVTGMLLYRDRFFIQVLEGEQDVVEPLFDVIAADDRHTNVLKIYSNEISERSFSDWSMGFNKLEEVENEPIPGYNDFLTDPTAKSDYITKKPDRAGKLLENFKERTYF